MSMKPANIKLKVGAKGAFHVEVIRNQGTPFEYREECGIHKNKIVNQGLDWWGATTSGFGSVWQGLAVGTGNATPSATDTVLSAPLAYQSNYSSPSFGGAVTSAPYSITYNWTTTFSTGAVVGNVAELGVIIGDPANASAKVFSRALIMVGGSPGTITLTSADQLVVTYQLQITFAAETSGSFTLSTDGTPSTINWQCIPWRLGNGQQNPQIPIECLYDGSSNCSFLQNASSFLPVTTSNEPTGAMNTPAGAYTVGTYNKNFTGNIGAGGAATYQLCGLATNLFSFQFLLSTPISKLSTQSFQIVYNMSWADVS